MAAGTGTQDPSRRHSVPDIRTGSVWPTPLLHHGSYCQWVGGLLAHVLNICPPQYAFGMQCNGLVYSTRVPAVPMRPLFGLATNASEANNDGQRNEHDSRRRHRRAGQKVGQVKGKNESYCVGGNVQVQCR